MSKDGPWERQCGSFSGLDGILGKSGGTLLELWETVCNIVPGCFLAHPDMPPWSDTRIGIERARANRDQIGRYWKMFKER